MIDWEDDRAGFDDFAILPTKSPVISMEVEGEFLVCLCGDSSRWIVAPDGKASALSPTPKYVM